MSSSHEGEQVIATPKLGSVLFRRWLPVLFIPLGLGVLLVGIESWRLGIGDRALAAIPIVLSLFTLITAVVGTIRPFRMPTIVIADGIAWRRWGRRRWRLFPLQQVSEVLLCPSVARIRQVAPPAAIGGHPDCSIVILFKPYNQLRQSVISSLQQYGMAWNRDVRVPPSKYFEESALNIADAIARSASIHGGKPVRIRQMAGEELEEVAEHGPGAAPGQPSFAAGAAGDVVEPGVYCLKCGFNLRSLKSTSVCPECGLSIHRSRQGRGLHLAEPHWLRRIGRGAVFAACGFGVGAVVVSVAMALVISGRSRPAQLGGLKPILVAGFAVSVSLFVIAAVLMTKREAIDHTRRETRKARKLAQLGWCLPPCVFVGLLALGLAPSRATFLAMLSCGAPVAWLLMHASQLLIRLSREKLAALAGFAAWLLNMSAIMGVLAPTIPYASTRISKLIPAVSGSAVGTGATPAAAPIPSSRPIDRSPVLRATFVTALSLFLLTSGIFCAWVFVQLYRDVNKVRQEVQSNQAAQVGPHGDTPT